MPSRAVVGHEGYDLRIGIVAGGAVDRITHPCDRQRQSVRDPCRWRAADEAAIDNGMFSVAMKPLSLFACDPCTCVVKHDVNPVVVTGGRDVIGEVFLRNTRILHLGHQLLLSVIRWLALAGCQNSRGCQSIPHHSSNKRRYRSCPQRSSPDLKNLLAASHWRSHWWTWRLPAMSRGAPQVHYMRARILRPLVESDPCNLTTRGRA